MPATAWLHIGEDQLSDHFVPRGGRDQELTGLARCYQISDPIDFDGDGQPDKFVVVRVLFDREHMHPEVAILPCDERGVLKGYQVVRRGGSFTIPRLHCPKDNAHAIDWCIALAFGFYDVVVGEAPEPEPEPDPDEPRMPEGLDYDPDELPDSTWYFEPEDETDDQAA